MTLLQLFLIDYYKVDSVWYYSPDGLGLDFIKGMVAKGIFLYFYEYDGTGYTKVNRETVNTILSDKNTLRQFIAKNEMETKLSESLVEKISGVSNEFILSESEELGRVIDLKGIWCSLNPEERIELSRQIDLMEVERLERIPDEEGIREEVDNINSRVKSKNYEIYLLVNPERQVVGFLRAYYTVYADEDAFYLAYILTAETEIRDGQRGGILMDALRERIKAKGIKKLIWVPTSESRNFFDTYFQFRGIKYKAIGGGEYLADLGSFLENFLA